MRNIKTRRARKRELARLKIVGFGFVILALMAGAVEFMFWYLMLIPDLMFGITEALAFALLIIGIKVVDDVETEIGDMWVEMDI